MSTDVTRRTVLAGTGAAAVLSATGVSLADEQEDDEEDDTEESNGDGDAEFAAVNAVHASPDAPNVDVFVNGARVLEDVAFRHFSDYLALLQGEYTVQIVPVGGPTVRATVLEWVAATERATERARAMEWVTATVMKRATDRMTGTE
ncbi:DUF4397 domain-containing protein [Natronoarchaeum sp. GCM10025703]|uniref:DUF4397 domain-containing protein n=1 Tax=Natronoarchaeum sp. GCM10025703 TaxID=3252685 RepID=UPI003613DB94